MAFDRAELDADREIDVSALDVEAATQADKFFKWSERAIEAKLRAKDLELAASTLESQLQIVCRDHPDKFGLSSVTEAAVKAAVKCSPQYLEAVRAYMAAEKEAALLDAARAAMDMKKRMIQELVTLHGQQYFAGPSVPRNLIEAYAEHRNRRETKSMDRMRAAARRR